MRYVEPNDGSVEKTRSDNAIHIILKSGIIYDDHVGTRVMTSAEALAAAAAFARSAPPTRPATVQIIPVTPAPAPTDLPAYRLRVLGVFDLESGAAIAGAQVTDVLTGLHVNTSVTGTVTLAFLPEGTSTVRIFTPGQEELAIVVRIAADATLPITVVLPRRSTR